MTELEVRLRQELQDMAQRLAPADLRPLREPPARDPARRARWLAPVAAMAAIVSVFGGLALVHRPAGTTTAVRLNERPVRSDPALVAVAGMSGSGLSYTIVMMSPRTGRVVRVVARVGTGNGFALSPDSKDVYVVGPAGKSIMIRQIAVATGRRRYVADGAYPAVSPDSRYLAYTTGGKFTEVAVRDLRTGSTRVINLRSLIGKDGNFLNGGTVTWLGDGSEILAVPGGVATFAGHTSVAGTASTARSSRAVPSSMRAVVVRVRPGGLSARRISIRVPPDPFFSVISGDLSRRQSFLMALEGSPATGTRKQVMGTLTEVSLRGRGVVERRIARLPSQIMPVAIAPDGDRIVYLLGHRPPALWAATIRNGRLVGRHRLLTDSPKFEFDQAAW